MSINDYYKKKHKPFKVYTNIYNGTFNIVMLNNTKKCKVDVYNILGVKLIDNNDVEGSTLIDLKNESNGIYIIIINVEGIFFIEKVILSN